MAITSAFTPDAYVDMVVLMTSGAASGQSAVIEHSTSTTTFTLVANGADYPASYPVEGFTTAPSSGDTCSIWATYTNDGQHPTTYAHTVIGAGTPPAGQSWQTFAGALPVF